MTAASPGFFALVLAGALCLPGAAAAQSAFAGRWAGSWDAPEVGQNGDAALVIAEDGAVTGMVRNHTAGLTGPFAGTIGKGGQARLRYSYDGGATYARAEGTCRPEPPGLTCVLAFIMADGRGLGQGTFRFAPAGRGGKG